MHGARDHTISDPERPTERDPRVNDGERETGFRTGRTAPHAFALRRR